MSEYLRERWIFGDHPPLEALPSDALSKADITYLLDRLQQRWMACDDTRRDLTPPHDQKFIDEQLRIEAVQNKLKVLW